MTEPMEVDTVDCDFLLVGAGSSGCVLASRLVRRGLKVLLVEKGTTDVGKLDKLVRRPSEWMAAATSRSPLVDHFVTVPQANLFNRRMHAMRGCGGGGSSNINAGLYCRGREEDYKGHWPWKLEDIEASFESIESELTLEEPRSSSTVGLSWERMLEEMGCKRASLTGEGASLDSRSTDDKRITWTKEGLGGCANTRTTRRQGERQSAWAAFIAPVAAMPNLRIKSDSAVTRVIIERGRAVGIELLEYFPTWRGGRSRLRQLRLANEVAEIVLCSGVFRTPKLLMLSGVGPKEHLEDKGIPVLVNMPHVGENLQDHLLGTSMHLSKTLMSPADFAEDGLHGMAYIRCPLRPESGDSEIAIDTGGSKTNEDASSLVLGFMFADGGIIPSQIVSIMRLTFTQSGFLGAMAREVIFFLVWLLVRLTPISWIAKHSLSANVALTTVKSRGTVRLASGDPTCPPVIDPAYLSHPDDEQAIAAAWRTLRRAKTETATGKAVLGYEISPGKIFNNGRDDKSFLTFFKHTAFSFFHPVGTCRMGQGPEDSVVSANSLRVHGVSGLRVADASVAPRIPSVPTQAMAMMIGDRAAALVLGDMATKNQVQVRMFEAASKSVN